MIIARLLHFTTFQIIPIIAIKHIKSSVLNYCNQHFKVSALNQRYKAVHQNRQSVPSRHLLLWTVPFLASNSEERDNLELKTISIDRNKRIKKAIQEADELFESNKYQETISALLPYKGSSDVEVLWRLSRAQYNLSQSSAVTDAEKKQLIHEAYSIIMEALGLDDSHWAVHKWVSVLLDARFTYDGIKARVTQLERVKHHMLRAAELNPKDATSLYMLGLWCYNIADMPWVQRKIAAAIFAAPPTSSFEEALQYFSKAEEVQPRFYSQNLLMLGKTLMKLQRPEEARHYLVLARDYPCTTEEDNTVRKEAEEILKNWKTDDNARKY